MMGDVEERAEESAEHVGASNKGAYVGAALGRAHRGEGGKPGRKAPRSPFARRKAARKEKTDAPAPTPPPAPEPRKLTYREEQFQRKHQWKFEQGERDRQRKADQEARYQRNLTLKQAGYQWRKVQDVFGRSDDGDNADMVWQLVDPQGKPVSEAEALRRIQRK
jgi:hypothetical protein